MELNLRIFIEHLIKSRITNNLHLICVINTKKKKKIKNHYYIKNVLNKNIMNL